MLTGAHPCRLAKPKRLTLTAVPDSIQGMAMQSGIAKANVALQKAYITIYRLELAWMCFGAYAS